MTYPATPESHLLAAVMFIRDGASMEEASIAVGRTHTSLSRRLARFGITVARLRSLTLNEQHAGRTPDAVIDRAIALIEAGHTQTEASLIVGLSLPTLYRHLKERQLTVSAIKNQVCKRNGPGHAPDPIAIFLDGRRYQLNDIRGVFRYVIVDGRWCLYHIPNPARRDPRFSIMTDMTTSPRLPGIAAAMGYQPP